MSRKQELKDKIDVAYYKHTGLSGGYDVFCDKVYKETQEKIAYDFGVTLATSHRWHTEFKQLQSV